MLLLPWCPPFNGLPGPLLSTALAKRASADNGEVPPPAQDGLDGALFPDREHDDRHTVFPGKREGRRVHDLEVLFQRFLMAETVIALGAGVLFRIGGVDA